MFECSRIPNLDLILFCHSISLLQHGQETLCFAQTVLRLSNDVTLRSTSGGVRLLQVGAGVRGVGQYVSFQVRLQSKRTAAIFTVIWLQFQMHKVNVTLEIPFIWTTQDSPTNGTLGWFWKGLIEKNTTRPRPQDYCPL